MNFDQIEDKRYEHSLSRNDLVTLVYSSFIYFKSLAFNKEELKNMNESDLLLLLIQLAVVKKRIDQKFSEISEYSEQNLDKLKLIINSHPAFRLPLKGILAQFENGKNPPNISAHYIELLRSAYAVVLANTHPVNGQPELSARNVKIYPANNKREARIEDSSDILSIQTLAIVSIDIPLKVLNAVGLVVGEQYLDSLKQKFIEFIYGDIEAFLHEIDDVSINDLELCLVNRGAVVSIIVQPKPNSSLQENTQMKSQFSHDLN